jgi:hypothetical protein
MTLSTLEQWVAEARALGVEHAQNAADWAFDGNSDVDERARVLAMMQDGDPAAYDYLPAMPNLSGEWADSPTPRSLYERITGADADQSVTDEEWQDISPAIDALADAYEDGVSDTFGPACEAALVEFVGGGAQ